MQHKQEAANSLPALQPTPALRGRSHYTRLWQL